MASKGNPKIWVMKFHPLFTPEYATYNADAKIQLFAAIAAIKKIGPSAGRPLVGTLRGRKHANLKEMRFDANNGNEIWRVVFAFDTNGEAVILHGGMKQGIKEDIFYKSLIKKAESRFSSYLKAITAAPPLVTTKAAPVKKVKNK